MSACVGIDVHRKRSQVAVINEGGEVLANRNVPNGAKPVLSVIGGPPAGTPAAYEAAFGWGWLLELLEGHGFEPHMVHPLQCKAIASTWRYASGQRPTHGSKCSLSGSTRHSPRPVRTRRLTCPCAAFLPYPPAGNADVRPQVPARSSRT